MLRRLQVLWLLVATLFATAACDGLTVETAKRTVVYTGTPEDTGGSETDTGAGTAVDIGTDAEVDTAADTADATDTATDTVSDTRPDTNPGAVDCTAIPIAATSSETCDQAAPSCAPGAACIGLGNGLGAECLQICTPGWCSDLCGAEGTCSGLVDQNNNPLLQDLDDDGTEEEVGACFPVVRAFSLCGTPTTGGCADGQICVGDATAANCTPTCSTPGASCGNFNGVEALCNVTLEAADGTTQNGCSIDCTTAVDCPTGLSCVAITGGSICLARDYTTAPLGALCTSNAECSSGFCSRGPAGTANDRCAPTDMVWVPSGTFVMGSPTTELVRETDESQHEVTLTRAFFLGDSEVTQGQWKAVSGGLNPSYFQNTTCTSGGCRSSENANDAGPVEYLDWYSAIGFANARSRAEGLTSCYALTGCADPTNGWKDGIHSGCTNATFAGLTCTGYRLPTESEWEYAARAGTTTATYLGNLSGAVDDCTTPQPSLDGIAWWCRNSGERTRPVKSKAQNSWGLYDTLGSVYEWQTDWFGNYPGRVADPIGPPTSPGFSRVARGGAWNIRSLGQRAADRMGNSPTARFSIYGLRLARTAP